MTSKPQLGFENHTNGLHENGKAPLVVFVERLAVLTVQQLGDSENFALKILDRQAQDGARGEPGLPVHFPVEARV